MNKTQHPTNNLVLGAPAGWDQSKVECSALAVTKVETEGGDAMISFWEPTAEERKRIAAGAKVALWVFGRTHPPVAVEVES